MITVRIDRELTWENSRAVKWSTVQSRLLILALEMRAHAALILLKRIQTLYPQAKTSLSPGQGTPPFSMSCNYVSTHLNRSLGNTYRDVVLDLSLS